MSAATMNYGEAIREGFRHLLENHAEVFAIGQGLWSPWYVGSSMTNLEKDFGLERVIDTPVSELATTGAAVGAALGGYRPIVIHPRMDFMVLATDPIVNQAAKWHHMLGGAQPVPVTFRGIINRGGEQGAQHSQALHAWYAHIPGLGVVMPATPADARDLLISAVLSDDPVVYIDDRWLYEIEAELPPVSETPLAGIGPAVRRHGTDITFAAAGYSLQLCLDAAAELDAAGVSAEVIDIRVLNPLDATQITDSVTRTGRLLAVDGGWSNCGLAAEVMARVAETLAPADWRASPARITLPAAPAPTSKPLEAVYYPSAATLVERAQRMLAG